MTLAIINQAIRAICKELVELEMPIQNWHLMAEEELLYEAAVCIFGSQCIFEVAVAMADRLRDQELLQPLSCIKNKDKMEQCFIFALSDPLSISNSDGLSHVSKTVMHLCSQQPSLKFMDNLRQSMIFCALLAMLRTLEKY